MSPLLVNTLLKILAIAISKGTEIKGTQIGRKEIKLLLFTDDTLIVYVESSKETSRKLLGIIRQYSKVIEHKINIQKSVASLYSAKN